MTASRHRKRTNQVAPMPQYTDKPAGLNSPESNASEAKKTVSKRKPLHARSKSAVALRKPQYWADLVRPVDDWIRSESLRRLHTAHQAESDPTTARERPFEVSSTREIDNESQKANSTPPTETVRTTSFYFTRDDSSLNPLSPAKKSDSPNDSSENSVKREEKATLDHSIFYPTRSKLYQSQRIDLHHSGYGFIKQYIIANIELYTNNNETIPTCLIDMRKVIEGSGKVDAAKKIAKIQLIAKANEENKPASCLNIFSRRKAAKMKDETATMNELITQYNPKIPAVINQIIVEHSKIAAVVEAYKTSSRMK
jgi:hypothetical protein